MDGKIMKRRGKRIQVKGRESYGKEERESNMN